MININDLKIDEYYFAEFMTLDAINWDEFIMISYISSDYILCDSTYGGLYPFVIWSDRNRLILNLTSIRGLTEYEKSRIIRV